MLSAVIAGVAIMLHVAFSFVHYRKFTDASVADGYPLDIYLEIILALVIAIGGTIFGARGLKPLKLVDQPVTRTFEMAQAERSDFNIFNHRGRAIQQRLAAARAASAE